MKHLKLLVVLSAFALSNAQAMMKTHTFSCPPGQHIVATDSFGSPICR